MEFLQNQTRAAVVLQIAKKPAVAGSFNLLQEFIKMIYHELLEVLRLNPIILTHLIQQISLQKLNLRRKQNCWTIYEHVVHLENTQRMLIERLKLFINEENPRIIPYNPASDNKEFKNQTVPVEELLSSFTELRNQQLELIRITPENLWIKKAIHPEYTDYSYEILVRHILLHDSFHLYRIEELWLARDEFLSDL
jgi:hypothetical protein